MRTFKTAFDPMFLANYQEGVMRFKYRGIECLKSPIDLAIYSRLIWDLRPGSIIELGSNKGGSALWLADTMSAYNLPGRVISIDVQPPTFPPHERLRFLEGDVSTLGLALTEPFLASLPRPLLMIDDSSHLYGHVLAVLDFAEGHLSIGDFLVIEDGNLDELGLSEQFNGGPNRAIREFLERSSRFEIATEYCDMFGTNATYNPNGYLRVI
jgi:cephalosporin hydroxylase